MTDSYDTSKGGWQRVNGTLLWVNTTSSTPYLDSLVEPKRKPRERSLSEILGKNI